MREARRPFFQGFGIGERGGRMKGGGKRGYDLDCCQKRKSKMGGVSVKKRGMRVCKSEKEKERGS